MCAKVHTYVRRCVCAPLRCETKWLAGQVGWLWEEQPGERAAARDNCVSQWAREGGKWEGRGEWPAPVPPRYNSCSKWLLPCATTTPCEERTANAGLLAFLLGGRQGSPPAPASGLSTQPSARYTTPWCCSQGRHFQEQ